MNIDQYQLLAMRSLASDMSELQQEDMSMLGMVGELGEFTELFKKGIFHGKDIDPLRVSEEAGDFLWYIALAAKAKKARLSAWAGLSDLTAFDSAAKDALDKAMAQNADFTRWELHRQPPFFFHLAGLVTGQTTLGQALTTLAVILEPYGGLAEAARNNVRKLEARHGLPEGNLEAEPEVALDEPTQE